MLQTGGQVAICWLAAAIPCIAAARSSVAPEMFSASAAAVFVAVSMVSIAPARDCPLLTNRPAATDMELFCRERSRTLLTMVTKMSQQTMGVCGEGCQRMPGNI